MQFYENFIMKFLCKKPDIGKTKIGNRNDDWQRNLFLIN